jgi:hypothetical protein
MGLLLGMKHTTKVFFAISFVFALPYVVSRILESIIQRRLPPGHPAKWPEVSPPEQQQEEKEYFVPNIRTRAFWYPFLLWLGLSSVLVTLMAYDILFCPGCVFLPLGMLALAITWKRNCRPINRHPRNSGDDLPEISESQPL